MTTERFTGRGYEGAAWLRSHVVVYYEEVREAAPEYVLCSLDPAARTVWLWGGEQTAWTNPAEADRYVLDGFVPYEDIVSRAINSTVDVVDLLRAELRARMRATPGVVEGVTHRLEETTWDDDLLHRRRIRVRGAPLDAGRQSRPDPEGLSRAEVWQLFGVVRPTVVLPEGAVREAMANGVGWSAFPELLGDDRQLPARGRLANMPLTVLRGALLRRMHDIWAALKVRWSVPLAAADVLACHNAEHRGRVLQALGYEAFLVSAKQAASIIVRDTDWPNQLLVIEPRGAWSVGSGVMDLGITLAATSTMRGGVAWVRGQGWVSESPGPLPPIALLAVQDSTSGKRYLLRVPPDTRTVKGGLAWTFNMRPEEYALAAET